jgi:glycerophosphoryl diester phosphodiesterase
MGLKIAHRGLSQYYKDNSRLAFEKAIENKFDMIELDIQQCKDGNIVVYHDIYYKNKYIKEYNSDELYDENILSLSTFLDIVRDNPIKLFFDLKGNEEVVVILLDTIIKTGGIDYNNVYISSFNRLYLDIITEYKLPIKIGFTTSMTFNENDFSALLNNIDFVVFDWTCLQCDIIELCKNKKILVFSYTVENDFILNHMRSFNVDGIVSNYMF